MNRESEIREGLLDIASDVPGPIDVPPTLVGRSRRRMVLTVTVMLLIVGAVTEGSSSLIRGMGAPIHPARRPPINVFTPLGGWLVYGSRQMIAVDPSPSPSESSVQLTASGSSQPGGVLVTAPIVWAADGTSLLFLRSQSSAGGAGLYRLHPDGSETLVIRGRGIAGAAFSPDSGSIVFSKAGSLYEVPAAGGTPTLVLGGDPSAGISFGFPNWSPSGDLQFVRSSATGTSIMTMKLGGSPRDTIDLGTYAVGSISWSPDGSRIAFTARRAGARPIAFLLGSDGSHLRRLTTGRVSAAEVTWSPDGSQIAYLAGGVNLIVATPDGTQVARLPVAYACCGLAWNPAPPVSGTGP